MARQEVTRTKLIEKIVRARVRLEDMKLSHKGSCVVEADPEGFAPCNCGASRVNHQIQGVLDELTLE